MYRLSLLLQSLYVVVVYRDISQPLSYKSVYRRVDLLFRSIIFEHRIYLVPLHTLRKVREQLQRVENSLVYVNVAVSRRQRTDIMVYNIVLLLRIPG